MRKSLIKSCLRQYFLMGFTAFLAFFGILPPTATAADKPAYFASFDPAKGFKPAQSDLTEVFLQIAGSLEAHGSPEPYLRHMQAEHVRIEAKYQKQLGRKPESLCPAYMDAAYLDRSAANWQHISAQLHLDILARNMGQLMRLAVNGPDGKRTLLADVFQRHQQAVDAAMTGNTNVPMPGFDALEAELLKCLRLDDSPQPVAGLSADQQAVVQPAAQIRAAFLKIFSALDAGLPAADAEKVKAFLSGTLTDVGRMAESEIEAARVEASLDYRRSLEGPYSPEQETALSAEEKQTYVKFLQKPRFRKADLPALDTFYSTIYDRLTERGKDEMSKRLHAGMRSD